MCRNSKNLHRSRNLAVNDAEVKDFEAHAANIGLMNDTWPQWHFTGKRECSLELRVVAATQPFLFVFVVGNLPFVFTGCLWMQLVIHLKRD